MKMNSFLEIEKTELSYLQNNQMFLTYIHQGEPETEVKLTLS
jgi:hypothetical protein